MVLEDRSPASKDGVIFGINSLDQTAEVTLHKLWFSKATWPYLVKDL